MNEVVCLELSIALWLVHVFVQGVLGFPALGGAYLASPRDEEREPRGVMFGRATRALRNYVENLAPFVAADLGLIVTQHAGGWGATLWIAARIVYLPLYMYGVSPARSAVWWVSLIGLIMMLARLAF